MTYFTPISSRRAFASTFARMWRVWAALFFRELDDAGETALGVLMQFVEPIIMIFATCGIAWLIDRHPPFGNSMILFASTGVAPIYLFAHISMQSFAFPSQPSSLHRDFDIVLVRAFYAFFKTTVAVIAMNALLYFTQTAEALPSDLGLALTVWLIVATLALGVGLTNRSIVLAFPAWEHIYPAFARIVIHLSGVYYIIDTLPIFIRNWIWFNPLSHATTWFRLAFYPRFPHYTLSTSYLLTFTFAAACLGAIMQLRFRDRVANI